MALLKGKLLQKFVTSPRLRRLVTSTLYGNHDQSIDLVGTQLTINTIKENGYLRASKMGASSSLFRDEIAVIINLVSILGPGDTFVDIGANVGFYTHTLSRLKHIIPNFKMYAFEANPDTYSRLVKSIDPDIVAHQVALSSKSDVLKFVEGAVSHVFTTSDHANIYNIKERVVEVKAERLDSFDLQGDSLVIKIDVEGQELEVLKGATGLMQSNRVKAVYLDGYADSEVETILKDHGFAFFNGRSLQRITGSTFSLLAVHPEKYPLDKLNR